MDKDKLQAIFERIVNSKSTKDDWIALKNAMIFKGNQSSIQVGSDNLNIGQFLIEYSSTVSETEIQKISYYIEKIAQDRREQQKGILERLLNYYKYNTGKRQKRILFILLFLLILGNSLIIFTTNSIDIQSLIKFSLIVILIKSLIIWLPVFFSSKKKQQTYWKSLSYDEKGKVFNYLDTLKS